MRLRLLFLFLLPVALFAQTVRWVPSDDDTSALQLVFENCSPKGEPNLPVIDGVNFSFGGTSSQTSIVNFSMTSSVIMNYTVRARQGGKIRIPSFTVQTDKGPLPVPAYEGANAQPSLEGMVSSFLQPAATTVWAGQIIPIDYRLSVLRRNYAQPASNVEWASAPLIAEDWSKLELSEASANNESYINVISHTRAIAKTPGTYQLKPANQLFNLVTGLSGMGFFQQQRIEQVKVTSNTPTLTVKPLPASAPEGFSGAVGTFKLEAKVVPLSAAVGEPITWTLTLSGSGNWPDISGLPAREISKDFQVIQPHAKRTNDEGKLFDGSLSEDAVLLPTKPGTYTLEPIDFSYFDPASGTYKTLNTPRTTVTITAAPPSKFNISTGEPNPATPSAASAISPADHQPKLDTLKNKISVAPTGIPRDPLPAASPAPRPFTRRYALLACALAPLLALLLFWLWLAFRRAKKTDRLLARREAAARLAATLAKLRTSPADDHAELLLAWQHDTAILWPLTSAAPAAADLNDVTWSALWNEADRVIYGPRATLTADWLERAQTALKQHKLRAFSAFEAFLPRNLFPFFVLVALFALSMPLHAADISSSISHLPSSASAAEAYAKGDFASAEKIWRDALLKNPTDWSARHNLSLVLAQQNHAPEAAAQAAIAFVQHPGDEAVRWNFLLACDKAGYVPTPLATFVQAGPQASLARLASPGGWENLLIGSAILSALAVAGLLWLAYDARTGRVWRRWLASLALIVGVLLIFASLIGRAAYGEAARPTAAIIWHPATLRSIPTEADVDQKTTAVVAGAVGVMDKTFLGWARLSFENGQTGWVRKEDLVAFWQ